MYECNICLTKLKERNKNKHEKSKKHRSFLSNMIVIKYIVKNIDINNFKDFLQSYYDEHKNKFNEFTVTIIWKKNDMIKNKISILRTITLQRSHMFKPDMFEIPIYVKVSQREFLDFVDRNCAYNLISDEITIIFISKLKEMTLQNYMKQPRSMLCRKLERDNIEENYQVVDNRDFEYNSLRYCFRHIGFQPSPLLDFFVNKWKQKKIY